MSKSSIKRQRANNLKCGVRSLSAIAPKKRDESRVNKEPVFTAQRHAYKLDTYVGITYHQPLIAPKIELELIDSTEFTLIKLPSQF
jgi:hypothetical protein